MLRSRRRCRQGAGRALQWRVVRCARCWRFKNALRIGGGLHCGAGPAALARRRWRHGYVCARACGARRSGRLKARPRTFECARCGHQESVKRGDDLRPHPHAAPARRTRTAVAQMVPGGVVDGARQARGLGPVAVARVGAALRDRVADGPQTAPCPDRAPGVLARGLGRGRCERLRAGGQSRKSRGRSRANANQSLLVLGGREAAGRAGPGPGRRVGSSPAPRGSPSCRRPTLMSWAASCAPGEAGKPPRQRRFQGLRRTSRRLSAPLPRPRRRRPRRRQERRAAHATNFTRRLPAHV